MSSSLFVRVAALTAASMVATVTYGAEVASATISSMQTDPGSSCQRSQ
jgi:hypothetical protein